ncbi:LuxR C-terminal-related transcriptional regulator [Rhodococcus sp. NPDC058505]|uniref:LuxR C-terminal-related transcriptional regulator n=1 Tax=Rhodococcus sp. NPDC058505 TaxID=3346531 RepID=UPI003655AE8C
MTDAPWNHHRTRPPLHARPPQRRPRLIESLSHAMTTPDSAPVTVAMVSGPVGSGKSTLLANWADAVSHRTNPPRLAWLTVEACDNGRAAFGSAALAALHAIGDAEITAALPALPGPDDPGFSAAAAAVLGELGVPIVMVLDDVHLLHDPDTLEDLASFLRWAPPTLRTVLSGRFEPPVALHRLRLDGRVLDIGPHDLAFTDDEAAALLAEHDVRLAPEDLAVVQDRTHGWAAALRLAAISLAHHDDHTTMIADFSGDNRVVADYLVDEVLDRLDPDTRDFLVETSIPDAFNAELAESLSRNPNAHRVIDMLGRENLLVEPVAGAPGWYRYHPLLREYLRAEASRRGRRAVADLERVASQWFAASGADARSLEHALHAGDDEALLRLLSGLGFGAVLRGHADTVTGVLDRATRRVRSAPIAQLVRAAAELDRGNEAAAASTLAARAATPALRGAERRLERALRLRLALRRGGIERTLDTLQREAGTPCGEPDVDAYATIAEGSAELCLGRLDDAEQHLHDGLDTARSSRAPALELEATMALAAVAACRCRPSEIVRLHRDGAALARTHGLTDSVDFRLLDLLAVWGRTLRLDADPADLAARCVPELTGAPNPTVASAVSCLAAVLAPGGTDGHPTRGTDARDQFLLAHRRPLPPGVTALMAPAVHRALLDSGQSNGLPDVVGQLTAGRWPSASDAAVIAALHDLHRRRPDSARSQLAPVLTGATPCTAVTTMIRAWLAEAAIADGKNQAIAVRDALLEAVILAEPESLVLPFAEAGPGIRDLLGRHRGRFGSHEDFVGHILSRIPAEAAAPNPLTAREMELLLELPSWRTAEQIAADLFVSVNTVKTHLRGIYRKLEVGSRRDAITTARGLGLL